MSASGRPNSQTTPVDERAAPITSATGDRRSKTSPSKIEAKPEAKASHSSNKLEIADSPVKDRRSSDCAQRIVKPALDEVR